MWGAVGGALLGAGKWAFNQAKEHKAEIAGYLGERDRRNWQSGEAEKNRSFQERMANTAWQRGIKDMQAAGLNPALAYSQGPAASPGGSMASGAENAANSAMAVKQMRAQVSNITAQNAKIEQERRNLRTTEQGLQVDNALKLLAMERAQFEAQNYRAAGATIGTALDGLGMIPRGAQMLGYEAGRIGIRANPGVRLTRKAGETLRAYYRRINEIGGSLRDSLSDWYESSQSREIIQNLQRPRGN
jgi:hypothetical protein